MRDQLDGKSCSVPLSHACIPMGHALGARPNAALGTLSHANPAILQFSNETSKSFAVPSKTFKPCCACKWLEEDTISQRGTGKRRCRLNCPFQTTHNIPVRRGITLYPLGRFAYVWFGSVTPSDDSVGHTPLSQRKQQSG